jgi:hypothetical protein
VRNGSSHALVHLHLLLTSCERNYSVQVWCLLGDWPASDAACRRALPAHQTEATLAAYFFGNRIFCSWFVTVLVPYQDRKELPYPPLGVAGVSLPTHAQAESSPQLHCPPMTLKTPRAHELQAHINHDMTICVLQKLVACHLLPVTSYHYGDGYGNQNVDRAAGCAIRRRP